MEKPPRGKHSTKGLGKKVPDVSEHVKWKEDVVVPCGKPVASNVKASELMYNEYIVYDTAQVSFLTMLWFYSAYSGCIVLPCPPLLYITFLKHVNSTV